MWDFPSLALFRGAGKVGMLVNTCLSGVTLSSGVKSGANANLFMWSLSQCVHEGAVCLLNVGSIEFCKKRPSMVLQFGDRLSAVAGSPLGLISLKRERLTSHTNKCSWKSVDAHFISQNLNTAFLVSTRKASQKTWLKGVVGKLAYFHES